MAKMSYSHVGCIAFLRQLASFAKVGSAIVRYRKRTEKNCTHKIQIFYRLYLKISRATFHNPFHKNKIQSKTINSLILQVAWNHEAVTPIVPAFMPLVLAITPLVAAVTPLHHITLPLSSAEALNRG